jgi:nucleotide-binding universal stress UspA family protein
MWKKVLVALDGSETSARSIPWVRLLAPRAELVLLHSSTPVHLAAAGAAGEGAMATAYVQDPSEDVLKRLAEGLTPRPKMIFRVGSLAGIADEVAREESCDLVALASYGGSAVRRRLLGGAVEQLLHTVRLPILAVTARSAEPGPRKRVRRILVPVDGSPTSEAVLPWAVPLARRCRAQLDLLHCHPRGRGPVLTPAERQKGLVAPSARVMEAYLKDLAAGLRRKTARVATRLAEGTPAQRIPREARELPADLILMGVHAHGALSHFIHGALVSEVIQEAGVPVLAVRDDVPAPGK